MFHAAGSRVRFGLLDGTWVDVAALHSQLVYLCQVFYLLLFIVYYCIFYRFIVKRLCTLFVGGAIVID